MRGDRQTGSDQCLLTRSPYAEQPPSPVSTATLQGRPGREPPPGLRAAPAGRGAAGPGDPRRRPRRGQPPPAPHPVAVRRPARPLLRHGVCRHAVAVPARSRPLGPRGAFRGDSFGLAQASRVRWRRSRLLFLCLLVRIANSARVDWDVLFDGGNARCVGAEQRFAPVRAVGPTAGSRSPSPTSSAAPCPLQTSRYPRTT